MVTAHTILSADQENPTGLEPNSATVATEISDRQPADNDPLVARNGRCCQLYRLQPTNRNQDTAWQDWHREFNRRQYRNSGGREPTVHR